MNGVEKLEAIISRLQENVDSLAKIEAAEKHIDEMQADAAEISSLLRQNRAVAEMLLRSATDTNQMVLQTGEAFGKALASSEKSLNGLSDDIKGQMTSGHQLLKGEIDKLLPTAALPEMFRSFEKGVNLKLESIKLEIQNSKETLRVNRETIRVLVILQLLSLVGVLSLIVFYLLGRV